jgi:hypothetical protein
MTVERIDLFVFLVLAGAGAILGNIIAAAVAARRAYGTRRWEKATVVGAVLGSGVTMYAAWLLVEYAAAPPPWLAYPLGYAVAYGASHFIASSERR